MVVLKFKILKFCRSFSIMQFLKQFSEIILKSAMQQKIAITEINRGI